MVNYLILQQQAAAKITAVRTSKTFVLIFLQICSNRFGFQKYLIYKH